MLGLIFIDECKRTMLGQFDEEGIISAFYQISDDDDIYSDLQPTEFAVVQIGQKPDGDIELTHKRTITLFWKSEPCEILKFLKETEEMPDGEFEETWAGMYAYLCQMDYPTGIQ